MSGELAAAVASVEAIVGCFTFSSFLSVFFCLGIIFSVRELTCQLKQILRETRMLIAYFMTLKQEKFLTPDWIQQFECNISSAPLFMVDANLNLPALVASCQSIKSLSLSLCDIVHLTSLAANCFYFFAI